MKRTLWVTCACLILFATAAKPDTFTITFGSGANPGDGGTITTNGCTVCTDTDVTSFDFTVLGVEFASPLGSVAFSGLPGSLFGNDSVEFQSTAAQFPLIGFFSDGSWNFISDVTAVETSSRGTFTAVAEQDTVQTGTPEPSSLMLGATTLLALGWAVRRRYSVG
jgi:hypothetical protein